jgi:3-oxoacyl-[acyl-carrier protein] reductase
MRLKGQVALITGGAAGIGKATAERFAEQGAEVVICDVNEELGQAVVQALSLEAGPATSLGHGPSASFAQHPERSEWTGHRFYRVDVTARNAVREWVDDVAERYGRIDVLVNNAGIIRDALLVKVRDGELVKQMSEADFDLVAAVNLKGVFNCTQAVAPYMIRQGSGVILNAASIAGLDGNFGQTNYVAAKAGVIGMTKVWARELGRHNIRVNAVAPGLIATDMVASMPQQILDRMRERTPLHRLGQPWDVANAYLFLASDEASFISGAVLRVDGGLVVGT